MPIDMIGLGVAQRYSVLVAARNDTTANWAIHAGTPIKAFYAQKVDHLFSYGHCNVRCGGSPYLAILISLDPPMQVPPQLNPSISSPTFVFITHALTVSSRFHRLNHLQCLRTSH